MTQDQTVIDQLANYRNNIVQPLYDMVEGDDTTEVLNFFQQSKGQNFNISGDKKTSRHTNNTTPGALPSKQRLVVMGFSLSLTQMISTFASVDQVYTVFQRFFQESVFSFDMEDKNFLEIWAWKLLAGGGVSMVISQDNMAAVDSSVVSVQNGRPDATAALILDKPIEIEPLTTYEATLTFGKTPALNGVHRIGLEMFGILTRNVN